ncbi:WD40 repeat-like protein [Coccomyxa subellipsoidea C-169]|uniref:WD40 repeat-like protein n=1 Tax=Coccomyxa subellipsoidea (strain C-169) TaxID=574566 RepID=I0YML7_COCSC|nr:WD40 repeat-like protein [Coccomyxa subellipsoidea C-169]EIE19636.1 WD40 repeat-like protein [Coccomyxa subellipsoidea C-169]|eukprot:XP_005644180.1 WD40 repeat-like protein [Coccomyxa subellipsoidea C-169]
MSGDFEREMRASVLNKLPSVLREREFPCWRWKEFDKGFACEWLNPETVVVGTKCNKLICLNTTTQQFQRVALPRAPPRPPGVPQPLPDAPAVNSCGIHAIALSPDRRLLATGGANPSDCQILAVRDEASIAAAPQAPQLDPVQTLVGHTDWVFGIAWVTDRHVVTGSRDQRLNLWKVDTEPNSSPNLQPLVSHFHVMDKREEKNYKVRDVKFNRNLGRLASLTTNGCVQFWDPHANFDRNVSAPTSPLAPSLVKLKHSKEVVCLAMSDNLVAVGSQSHITLVDPRQKTPVQDVESLDEGHGVRSLNFLDHLLSAGSGRGRVFFYDLRASAYLDLDIAAKRQHLGASLSEPERGCLQCGTGYLNQTDPVYLEHFSGEQVFNACYSHAWDPTRTRLAAVGGPLAYGLRGSYMAVWN